jgi:hypothetical protein
MASVAQTKCESCGHIVKETYTCFGCKKSLPTEFAGCEECDNLIKYECYVCKTGLSENDVNYCEDCGMAICGNCVDSCTMFYCCDEFYEPNIGSCTKCSRVNPFFESK